jgi:ribokinase
VIGAINWDVSIFEEKFAKPGEEVSVKLVEEFSGGTGGNVAVAAARILGRRTVAFLGALGTDEVSPRQLKELRAEGVLTDGVVHIPGTRSGRAYIIIDSSGRKSIHTHFGANEKIRSEHLNDRRVSRVLLGSKLVVVMDPPTEVAYKACKMAKDSGKSVIYSPGIRSNEGMGALRDVINLADYLVLDRSELRNLIRHDDEEEIMKEFGEEYPRLNLIATMGERGCYFAHSGDLKKVSGVDLDLLGKKPVNTTGCGDAFLGVFAAYLLMGGHPLEAINWANLAGAMKAARYETRGSPTKRELEKSMARLEKIRRAGLGLESADSAQAEATGLARE